MSEETELINFSRELESDITDYAKPDADPSSATFRESAFTEIISDDLAASGVLESPVVCHFEGGQGAGSFKVDGYSVPEEDSRLDLFVTHYVGPSDDIQTINASHIEAAFNRVERFLGRAFAGHHMNMEPGLEPYGMTELIHDLHGKLDRVNFLLFTNARLVQRRERERKQAVHGLAATFDIWDLERYRRLRESGMSYEALNVDLRILKMGGLPAVEVEPVNDRSQTWVTVFPGRLLADLYDEHGARLLELNVRSYLQARGKVNKGILETLRDKPEHFMAYNNGITVVAEEVETGKLHDGMNGILGVKGLQIVNGGQTTASIHRAMKDLGADLSCVSVQGKITVVEPSQFQDLVPLISRYSNTQNKVSESDLSANQPFHIGMERVSRREWVPDQRTQWFYERARGSYQTAKTREGHTPARRREFETRFPPEKRFTKEDLAKFDNVWLGLPFVVCRGAQKNFVYFMNNLDAHPAGWEPPVAQFRQYIAKGILYRTIQRIVRQDETITAYRVNVTAYTASLLAERTARRIDLDRIWRDQKLSSALEQTAAEWAPIVFRHLPDLGLREGRHIEESFKTSACWDYIRSLDWAVPPSVNNELVSAVESPQSDTVASEGYRGERLTPDDHNNIARCKELSEQQWQRVVSWGKESGAFDERMRGIARTLAGYAAEGWTRSPSKKQAYQGAKMIDKARSVGILEKAS